MLWCDRTETISSSISFSFSFPSSPSSSSSLSSSSLPHSQSKRSGGDLLLGVAGKSEYYLFRKKKKRKKKAGGDFLMRTLIRLFDQRTLQKILPSKFQGKVECCRRDTPNPFRNVRHPKSRHPLLHPSRSFDHPIHNHVKTPSTTPDHARRRPINDVSEISAENYYVALEEDGRYESARMTKWFFFSILVYIRMVPVLQ